MSHEEELINVLNNSADYSGNKEMLQKRLEKVSNMKDVLPEYKEKLDAIDSQINKVSNSLPVHYKESMVRDLSNAR